MTHVTADIIFRTIFSEPMTGPDAHRVFDAFSRYQTQVPRLMLPSLFGQRWLRWPWDAWRSRRAAREIRGLLETLIRPRYAAHRGGCPSTRQDILASFLDARDPESGIPFSFEALVDQVSMLFLAGHETSASALTWATHLLAQAPDVQTRMQAEVSTLLGTRAPELGDMKELTLTRNVFRETLRLFPPVGFMARQTTSACPMRKKTVPAGATVVVAPWLIHRHRDLVEVKTHLNGEWPADDVIARADTILIYADGYSFHPAVQKERLSLLAKEMKRGCGFVTLHWATEVLKDKGGAEFLEWMGGYCEPFWSVNPHWQADFTQLPVHPIANGVSPFTTHDEWYFHMRFKDGMKSVAPILSAIPPISLKLPDGMRSGNAHVRQEVADRLPQHVSWATERADGGRGFGFTGGHNHKNWGNDDQPYWMEAQKNAPRLLATPLSSEWDDVQCQWLRQIVGAISAPFFAAST